MERYHPILADSRYEAAAWVGNAVLLVMAATAAFTGDWLALLFLSGFLAAAVGFVLLDRRLPRLFDFLFVTAAIVNSAGWAWRIYDKIPGYDEFAHFYTDFAVTLSVGYLCYFAVRHHFREHRIHFVLVIWSFGVSLGAFWEIFELVVLKKLTNPVVDLVMDTLGALLAGLAATWVLSSESDGGSEAERTADPPAS